MSQFYSFITKKFQTKNKLNIIFKSNRNIIPDFGYLSENDKYIYVSNKSIFEGLLFPLNKNLIHTYFQHFQEKEVDKFYFNLSLIYAHLTSVFIIFAGCPASME